MRQGHRQRGDSERVAALLLDVARPLLPALPELGPQERGRVEHDLSEFLYRQISALPHYMRLPFRLGLLAFQWLPALRHGRPYVELDPATRRRQVCAWSMSRVPMKRDLVKLVRSCALFFYLDHPVVVARLEEEARDVRSEAAGGHAD